jgi:hypothetical protein
VKPRFEVLDRDNPMKSKLKQNRKPNLNQPNIKGLKRKKKHLIKKKPRKIDLSKPRLVAHTTPQARSNCF